MSMIKLQIFYVKRCAEQIESPLVSEESSLATFLTRRHCGVERVDQVERDPRWRHR